MTPAEELQKIALQRAKLDQKEALAKVRQRKADAHRKIVLGGLVLKAGLGDCSEATILGGLLTIAGEMERYGAAFEKKGQQVLAADAAKRKDRTPAPPSSAPAPSGSEVGA
jgi:hypothetical protein